jgi:hypothetical protein
MKHGLAPAVAEKLAKVVGLLASDFDGERANAAAAATRLLQAHGMSWADLVRPPAAPEAPPRPVGHRARALEALRHGLPRTAWERAFLHSLAGQDRMSEKQAAVLRRIEERLSQAGPGQ